MKKINKFKESKGITLITIVITIVVLLIVSSITIATLSGNTDTVITAKEAKDNVELQSQTDEIQSIVTRFLSKSVQEGDFSGNVNIEELKSELSDLIETNSTKFPIEGTLKNGGQKITITEEGKVTVEVEEKE